MDVDDLFDWLTWGVLAFFFALMVLVVLALIFMAIAEAIYHLRRRHRRSKAPLSTDQLLATIPDVPYKAIPPDDPGDGGRDRCVICQSAYEVHDRCFVLPKCKHMFHRPCIATWLRKHVTCPLCRAIVVALVPDQQNKPNAAQNMV